jgi:lysyl-tRNA synthetase class 2
VSDIHIESISATVNNKKNFLQTSPEFYMKRILTMSSTDIYQICKVFRDHEKGSLHSSEFTLVEWYRMNFTLQDIINDTCQLISLVLAKNQNKLTQGAWTYQDIFIHYLGIDPINDDVKKIIKNFKFDKSLIEQFKEDKDQYLNYLFATEITNKFKHNELTVVSHFPASQAVLARITPNNDKLSDRFEVFFSDIELANGYVELTDSDELKKRITKDQIFRKENGLAIRPIDNDFIQAMEDGLPSCSGVALGFDRLNMIAEGKNTLEESSVFV